MTGLIITGAPVEQMEFEEVDYWEELVEIMDWSKKNVTSTLHLCWGAQAGLYHHFGAAKADVEGKNVRPFLASRVQSGRFRWSEGLTIFSWRLIPAIRRWLPRIFYNRDKLMVLAESDEAGVFLCMTLDGRQIFVMGHPEYDRVTLDTEYWRDLE